MGNLIILQNAIGVSKIVVDSGKREYFTIHYAGNKTINFYAKAERSNGLFQDFGDFICCSSDIPLQELREKVIEILNQSHYHE